MARRKRALLEDDDDSDSYDGSDLDDTRELQETDPDLRDERALFENPYKRKRQRKQDGREDAIYGVFGEDSEDEGFGAPKGKPAPKKKSDWAKAPAFVSGNKTGGKGKEGVEDETVKDESGEEGEEAMEGVEEDGVEDEDEDEDEDEEDAMDQSDSEPSKPPSPRVREEEEEVEQRPRGGLGLGASKPPSSTPAQPSAFAGFSRGGIGATRPASISTPPSPPHPPTSQFPTAFGGAPRAQRSFVRHASSSASNSRSATPLPAHERLHFSKLSGTFGARMLEKMGWQAGTGLGVSGEGIVTPVESKLRPQKMGIAFKGFKEKTEQSKMEAKRRGEAISDEEDDEGKRKRGKGRAARAEKEKGKREDAWKKPKKVKTRVEHKTYEEILAEAGEQPQYQGIGQIIDATGATPREVSSLAEVSMASWTPSTDAARIPEVRHNIRLIADACKVDLDGLAKEAKALEERKKFVASESTRLTKRVGDEAELIKRLQQVHLVADEISALAKDLASQYEASLDSFSPSIEKLLGQFGSEFDRYGLDEIVVAAIAPIFRRLVTQWRPLEDPTAFTAIFKRWRRALKIVVPEEKVQNQVDVYGMAGSGIRAPSAAATDRTMTPFESLLWTIWLPKIRSVINNDWSPLSPTPLVNLYESWSSFLPPFIRDNFFDQLVLPKVKKVVGDWNGKRDGVSLQAVVFPWLPHIGLRIEEVLGDAKRKVRGLLKGWAVRDGVPKDFAVWKNVFDASEWDAMMLKYVVPKLASTLRDEFRVNPRDQQMEPFTSVLAWTPLLRPTIISQLLEAEFFPKWLDVLHIWLIQPNASFEEVVQWYTFWKGSFPESVQEMPRVQEGFTRGLQLMNTAIELGPDAPTRLPRPEYRPSHHLPSSPKQVPSRQGTPKPPRASRTQEITFRSIVEEYAASHNLLFIPTGKVNETSRMPLYRVSQRVDGKGGLLVYVLDDAVWAPEPGGEEFRAVSLESMVARALKG
ncbi:hypothetical protein JAAARDRAFT_190163 [Jaapia argillacea MUCL 33604]|uniref:G-patch domain-containing protein n=1 Tax=Jaapia argillacea MUCL 33604 TaxID=933084 RepID=A0A067Q2T6_9AGAM|nr:hypothetical protein JAAARDRAFT_190163 [Jaapia argillacea MUCL 33604]